MKEHLEGIFLREWALNGNSKLLFDEWCEQEEITEEEVIFLKIKYHSEIHNINRINILRQELEEVRKIHRNFHRNYDYSNKCR